MPKSNKIVKKSLILQTTTETNNFLTILGVDINKGKIKTTQIFKIKEEPKTVNIKNTKKHIL